MEDTKLSESLKWNIFALIVSGFYPIDPSKNSKRKIILHIIYSVLIQLIYIVLQFSQITYMIQHRDDKQMILKMLPKVLEESQSIFQVAILWKHANRIRNLIKTFEEPGWDKTNKYSKSLIKSIPLGSALFSVQPIINGFLWLLYPYIDSDENFKLPLDIWIPHFLNIHFVLFYEVIVVTAAAIPQTIINTTICGLIAHANAQLKALRSSIEQINNPGIFKKEPKVVIMKLQLVKCIHHYELILRYVKELESIFTWATFLRFATSAIIICTSIVQIVFVSSLRQSQADKDSIEFLFNIVFGFGMLMELAIFCYFGDNLMSESSRIFHSIFNCGWVSSDPSFKRLVLIFMIRTQKPIVIWAGKFFELSIQCFVNVLKTSYSYYAVLRNMKLK